jgi:hypothetical protein
MRQLLIPQGAIKLGEFSVLERVPGGEAGSKVAADLIEQRVGLGGGRAIGAVDDIFDGIEL